MHSWQVCYTLHYAAMRDRSASARKIETKKT